MAYLFLEDGTLLEGKAVGAEKDIQGEMVFFTGMEGYQEALTDPAYRGQIVVMTYPLIGNYGINAEDSESDHIHASAIVVHELCDEPNNWLCEKSLETYLKEQNITGISGIDTRYLTKKIRAASGVLRGAILREKPAKNFEWKDFRDSASDCSAQTQHFAGTGKKVAFIDYGAKRSELEELRKRNCDVTVYFGDSELSQILSGGFAGVFLSSGPSDERRRKACSAQIGQLLNKLPVFGVGFGCELIAVAAGVAVKRLPHGHRGANQPVKNLARNTMLVTNQNHGNTFEEKGMPENAEITYRNWNDMSAEGIRLKNAKVCGVLFYPEKCSGPQDCSYLYDEFIALL